MSPAFCDDWDRALFEAGVLALFLRDPDGELRLQPDRTRDALRHAPGPFPLEPVHALVRDRATGHVHCVLATSPGLLEGHPRLEARIYDSEEDARAALVALGPAAVAPDGLP